MCKFPYLRGLQSLVLLFGLLTMSVAQTEEKPQTQKQKTKHSSDEEFADREEPCPGSRKVTGKASFGEYVVRTYRYPNAFGCFEISRNGAQIYKQHGFEFQIGGSPDLPLEGRQNELTPIGTDVTNLGQPDLVVGTWTGGAHCCFLFYVFELGPQRLRKVATIDAQHSDRSRFADVDNDGHFEFLTNDWTFAYWHTGFMQSPAPDLILRFREGKFRLALDLMRKASPSDAKLAERAKKIAAEWDPSESGPPAELWGEMLDLIYGGNAESARRFADECWPREKEGKQEFLKEFWRQLGTSAYWADLKELNRGKLN